MAITYSMEDGQETRQHYGGGRHYTIQSKQVITSLPRPTKICVTLPTVSPPVVEEEEHEETEETEEPEPIDNKERTTGLLQLEPCDCCVKSGRREMCRQDTSGVCCTCDVRASDVLGGWPVAGEETCSYPMFHVKPGPKPQVQSPAMSPSKDSKRRRQTLCDQPSFTFRRPTRTHTDYKFHHHADTNMYIKEYRYYHTAHSDIDATNPELGKGGIPDPYLTKLRNQSDILDRVHQLTLNHKERTRLGIEQEARRESPLLINRPASEGGDRIVQFKDLSEFSLTPTRDSSSNKTISFVNDTKRCKQYTYMESQPTHLPPVGNNVPDNPHTTLESNRSTPHGIFDKNNHFKQFESEIPVPFRYSHKPEFGRFYLRPKNMDDVLSCTSLSKPEETPIGNQGKLLLGRTFRRPSSKPDLPEPEVEKKPEVGVVGLYASSEVGGEQSDLLRCASMAYINRSKSSPGSRSSTPEIGEKKHTRLTKRGQFERIQFILDQRRREKDHGLGKVTYN